MKIETGTTVYHYSKGKGYVLHIQQRKRTSLVTCWFPKGCEFITRRVLVSGVGEITLSSHLLKQGGDDSMDSLLSSLMGKL